MPKRLQLSSDSQDWTAEIAGGDVTLTPGDHQIQITEADGRLQASSHGRVLSGRAIASGDTVWVTIDGEVFAVQIQRGARGGRKSTGDHAAFTPPMPATVVRIAVKPGDAVQDGDVLISLEAMKMEL